MESFFGDRPPVSRPPVSPPPTPRCCGAAQRTVFELLEQLLLHLQQEVVVVLHVLGRVHHQSAHQVGAVRLVADSHGTCDGTKVHVVLITNEEEEKRKRYREQWREARTFR